jgi:DNA-binding transcriptional MerR regulator
VTTYTTREAAEKLGLHTDTFRQYADLGGVEPHESSTTAQLRWDDNAIRRVGVVRAIKQHARKKQ